MTRQVVRLTMAQALVRYLTNQFTVIDGAEVPLFAGVFAIFGHGNVTCLGEALEAAQDQLPTWRGQNEQSMALAGMPVYEQIVKAVAKVDKRCFYLRISGQAMDRRVRRNAFARVLVQLDHLDSAPE
jgi:hypothetical protein